MKKKFPLFILAFISSLLTAQIAYYDAKLLVKKIDKDGDLVNDSVTIAILDNYVEPQKKNSWEEIEAAVQGNPFISLSGRTQSEGKFSAVARKAGMVSGLGMTNFADGLAKFLVSRAKQELSLAFFRKFKDDIEDKRYSDLRILFPQTYKVLRTIDKDIYMFSAYLNTLREAFIKDLVQTYGHLSDLVGQEKYKAYFERNPDMHTIIVNSIYIIDQYAKGIHPGVALEHYNPQTHLYFSDTSLQRNVRSGIETARLISSSFRSMDRSGYWVQPDSVDIFLRDTIARSIYLGLVYQAGNNIVFRNGNSAFSFRNMLEKSKQAGDSLDRIVQFVQKITYDGYQADQQLQSVRPTSDGNAGGYYKLYEASLDLFEDGFGALDLPYINTAIAKPIREQAKLHGSKWMFVARSAGELYLDAGTKNYASAILNLTAIMDTVLDLESSFKLELLKRESDLAHSDLDAREDSLKLSNARKKNIQELIDHYVENSSLATTALGSELGATAIGVTNYETVKAVKKVVDAERNVNLAKDNASVREKILRYGTFAAAIAGAQNSDEVQGAIEAIAMPAGSYSVKRNSKTNVCINGYLGYGYDFGNPSGVNGQSVRDQYKLNWNVTAPVGIAFSTAFNCKRSPGSFSLFVPLIDVGSLAGFRLANDTAALSRKITFGDILSPGLTFIYGIPCLPVSLSCGMIYKPSLAYDGKNGTFVSIPGMLRFNVSLLIDIPLINIRTRAKTPNN